MAQIYPPDENLIQLLSANQAFDYLFANQIDKAREGFSANDSPFHLLGLGVCAFLDAALGMETELMTEATRCLTLSEAGAKKLLKSAQAKGPQRFQPGLEWEILHADAVIMLGLTSALSETYMGYLQCIYSLNSAHSKFTKLYKAVFPNGLDDFSTPSDTPTSSRNSPNPSLISVSSTATFPLTSPKSGFFGRWSTSVSSIPRSPVPSLHSPANGPVEELIIAGTAFGFGLFNLVFSLLPGRIKNVVGFFGFHNDRKLALQALAVSAARKDVHSVFAGLVLMTYHGIVLLLSGYQADEAHIIRQYRAMVDSIAPRFPTGNLWILNRAKILRMTYDADGAIRVLQDALRPERPHSFVQADTLLVYELAWTLLAQRQYREAAEMFIRLTELNSWSHATYYFLAAGCYHAIKHYSTAQLLFDSVPSLLEKRKINGKDLPTEQLIKKKLAFFKQKHARRGGVEADYMQSIKISPADEIAIFWNMYSRVEKTIVAAHVENWISLSPPVAIKSPFIAVDPKVESSITSPGPYDLDTPDELALRSLLLGIVHRTAGEFSSSREFLLDAYSRQAEIETSTWIGGVAMFELAVLDLKETEAIEKAKEGTTSNSLASPVAEEMVRMWTDALQSASKKLDQALALATSSTDLSSRLDTRIAMLRDEIITKREMLKIK